MKYDFEIEKRTKIQDSIDQTFDKLDEHMHWLVDENKKRVFNFENEILLANIILTNRSLRDLLDLKHALNILIKQKEKGN